MLTTTAGYRLRRHPAAISRAASIFGVTLFSSKPCSGSQLTAAEWDLAYAWGGVNISYLVCASTTSLGYIRLLVGICLYTRNFIYVPSWLLLLWKKERKT